LIENLKAVIFDLDGVLFLSDNAHRQAYHKVLNEYGVLDFHYEKYSGMKTFDCMKIISENNNLNISDIELKNWAKKKSDYANEILSINPPIDFQSHNVIKQLSKRYRLALVSSSSKRNIELFLHSSQTKDFFELVMSGDDVVKGKPDPFIYIKAINELELQSDECLVIEDSLNGVMAAVKANIFCIGIDRNLKMSSVLKSVGAKIIIQDLYELIFLLDFPLRILAKTDILNLFPQVYTPSQWTAVIPAAGLGKRLGYHLPKILFPILGKPILEWIVELLKPYCKNFIFILSPEGSILIEPYIRNYLDNYRIIIQEKPSGMGDAVWRAHNFVTTPHTLVLWGDQILLKAETIVLSLIAHENRFNANLTFPTIIKKNPYIHFQRDESGKIIQVHQAREEKIATNLGENDCGVFLFNTKYLFKILEDKNCDSVANGKSTGEFNLIPLFPYFDQQIGNVCTLRIISEDETLGVNTEEDAQYASFILSKRESHIYD
jgi:beta-phosphoglucomutase